MGKLIILAEKNINGWTVTSQGIDVHGSGKTFSTAIEEFTDNLYLFIQELADEVDTLGPHLLAQKYLLDCIFESEE